MDGSFSEKSLYKQTTLMFEKDGYNYMLELKEETDNPECAYLHIKMEHLGNRRVWTLKVRDGGKIKPESLLSVFKELVDENKYEDHPTYILTYPKDENKEDDQLQITISIKHQFEQFNLNESYVLKYKKSEEEKQKEIMVKSGAVLAGMVAFALLGVGYKVLRR